MATLEDIGLLARICSTFTTSVYFGGVLYSIAVECPARKQMKNPLLMLDNWHETFPRAMNTMKAVALASFYSGALGWYLGPNTKGNQLVLGWTGLMMIIFPWTKLGIMPLNYQLLDYEGSKKKGEAWIQKSMEEWAWRHSVRVVLSGCATCVAAVYWTNIVKQFF
uniref:General transcription factor 3C polypeptide 1 n=1 Tax=Centropages dorsispinatus TaxID=1239308 RepID=A0A0U2V346_9MAXI|nr:general transcription factor 3C polypeptide 1 [Centropages dorsispinatus]